MPKLKKKSAVKESFRCDKCGQSLSSSYNLKIHMDTNCSTEKRFICEVCHSKFLTRNSLKTHLNSLHFGEKKFVCAWCGKGYLSKGQLKVHERSHTKEKSFVCGVCKKGFSHRESLVTHSTLHTGIKPYLCECCSSTFSCVGNLIKHRKVRPSTCGLPKYTNKKICKRAGVKCRGTSPKVVVSSSQNNSIDETADNYGPNEIIYESEALELPENSHIHVSDHQYIAMDQTTQLEDYNKKEMDVFDYIGIEIKNIQEQEEREKLLQMKNGSSNVEMIDDKNQEIEHSEENAEFEIRDLLVECEDESYLVESSVVIDDEPTEESSTMVIERLESIGEDCDEEEEFKIYIDTVGESSFSCKLCPKIYQKRHITIKHLKAEHCITLRHYNYDSSNRYRKPQKDLDWKCRFCARKYTSKRLAERHETVHGPNGDLLHKCSCCPLFFLTTEEMETHQHTEHEDKLYCKAENCNKKFDHPEKLVSHTKYAHSNKKASVRKYNFVCQLCGRNFNTKVALSDHERSNCGKSPIYQCSYCDKNYHSAGSLKCHQTIHTNLLEFPCIYCTKQFRTKGQLTVHLRSHTKEKNYKCMHCPAEFSHRESLLTHNTLHTGIKRFECSSCGSRFSCISNLLAHKKSRKNACGDSEYKKVSDADSSVKMCRNEPQ